ncbi:MAG: hypothetical protein ACRDRG_15265 [Pseudonocardiaceae bacterium]
MAQHHDHALLAWAPPVTAGLALGVAAVLKQSAWPGVVVGVALLAVLAGSAAAWRCALVVVTTVAAVLLPVLLGPTGASAVRQMAGFPLAASQIASPATTPTPGVLLAGAGPTARIVGLALLGGTVLSLAGWLLRRPPWDLTNAFTFLALAETIAALVLPTSRLGYLVYPAVMVAVGHIVAGSAARPRRKIRTTGRCPPCWPATWRTSSRRCSGRTGSS